LAYLHIQTTEDVWPKIKGLKDLNLPEWAMQGIVVPAVTIVLVLVIYYANIIPINANHALIQSMQISQIKPEQSIALFDKAIKMNSFGNPEIREQITSATIGWIQNQKLDQQFKINAVNFAYNEWKKQVALTPNDTRAYIFTTYLLNGAGAYEGAVPYMVKAEQLSPRKQSVLIEVANNLLSLGRTKEAVEKAQEMYDLNHNFMDGKIIYITLLIVNKDFAKAESLIAENDSAQIVADRRIVQAATNTGNTNWLKTMTEKYSVKK
jgi:tetratricopeptide (TPR) repeat protein